ncbi:MAG: preprotein translocase subunit SecG [Planctomycetes bacterium]|nr:preprotein translocase subunit SecG [Planctomycetota bacterium]
MQTVVLAIQIISCVVLVAVVLMQAGKEGMGVIFGGGSSSMFGGGGAGGLLVKITVAAAIIFLGSTVFYNALISKPAVVESVMITNIEGGSAIQENASMIEDPVDNASLDNASESSAATDNASGPALDAADAVSVNATNTIETTAPSVTENNAVSDGTSGVPAENKTDASGNASAVGGNKTE